MHYEFPWQGMSSFLRKDLRAPNKWRVYDSFLSHFSNLIWEEGDGRTGDTKHKGASGVMQWMSIKHFCEHQIMFHLSTFYILFDAKNLIFRLVWIIFECGSVMVLVVGAMTSNNKIECLFHFYFWPTERDVGNGANLYHFKCFFLLLKISSMSYENTWQKGCIIIGWNDDLPSYVQ
jgi:hypothetical protein